MINFRRGRGLILREREEFFFEFLIFPENLGDSPIPKAVSGVGQSAVGVLLRHIDRRLVQPLLCKVPRS